MEIMDVSDSPSILYVLNGGQSPPNLTLRNFAYDLWSMMFQIYFPDDWRNLAIKDIEFLV